MDRNGNPHLEELGEFLKTRRAELTPHAVGLTESEGMRRVHGLRREEVAQLAAISIDYYTRLEQGRIAASQEVLDALAGALRLNDDQRAYLYELAGKHAATTRKAPVQKIRPQMLRLLDHLTDIPAMIQNRRFDVLAWNPMAAALLVDFDSIPEQQRNYVRLLFTHPPMRELYDDWGRVARFAVALLRMEAAKSPEDARLTALVGELSIRDAQFREWWAAHDVASKGKGTRVFHHPVVGMLELNWDILLSASDPYYELIVWTAEPGSPAYEGLRKLAEYACPAPKV